MRIPLLIICCLLVGISFAQQQKIASSFIKPAPKPARLVNDFAKMLSVKEQQELETELAGYHKKTTHTIVIIILDSLVDKATKQAHTIEETALGYFNTWGIGDSVTNQGVLILLSKKEHGIRIATGEGMSDVLTDNACKRIIENSLVPNFKQGHFLAGLLQGVKDIQAAWANAPDQPDEATTVAPPAVESDHHDSYYYEGDEGNSFPEWGVPLFFFSLFIIIPGMLLRWVIKKARGQGRIYSRGGYQREGLFHQSNDHYHRHNNEMNTYATAATAAAAATALAGSSSDSFSYSSSSSDSFSSSTSDSFSSSSSYDSSSSFSGGSSDGGGASGSW